MKFVLPSSNHLPVDYNQEIKTNTQAVYSMFEDLGYTKAEIKPFVNSIVNLEHNESSIKKECKYLIPGKKFELERDRIIGILNLIRIDSKKLFLSASL